MGSVPVEFMDPLDVFISAFVVAHTGSLTRKTARWMAQTTKVESQTLGYALQWPEVPTRVWTERQAEKHRHPPIEASPVAVLWPVGI